MAGNSNQAVWACLKLSISDTPATFDPIVLLYTTAGKIKNRILLSAKLDGKGIGIIIVK